MNFDSAIDGLLRQVEDHSWRTYAVSFVVFFGYYFVDMQYIQEPTLIVQALEIISLSIGISGLLLVPALSDRWARYLTIPGIGLAVSVFGAYVYQTQLGTPETVSLAATPVIFLTGGVMAVSLWGIGIALTGVSLSRALEAYNNWRYPTEEMVFTENRTAGGSNIAEDASIDVSDDRLLLTVGDREVALKPYVEAKREVILDPMRGEVEPEVRKSEDLVHWDVNGEDVHLSILPEVDDVE